MVTKITGPPPRSAGRRGRARCSHCTSQASANGRAIRPDSDIRSVLAMESIQIVRLRPASLAAASASTPGPAPVVTTTSGRSARTIRTRSRRMPRTASGFLRVTLAIRW